MAGTRSHLSLSVAAAAVVVFAAVMLPEVAATRFMIGGNNGWGSNMNYTVWAQDKHFYLGDWLFFVYNRYQYNVLEVNQTEYESCISDHPIHNWTTGAGREVIPLNVTKTRYFISGNGFCFSGTKIAIHIEKTPPPQSSPVKSGSGVNSVMNRIVFFPVVITIGALWDSLLMLL